MHPVDFEGTNQEILFGNLKIGTDESELIPVPVRWEFDYKYGKIMTMAYMPSKEDMDAFHAGRPVFLSIMGDPTPPATIYTKDENGIINSSSI